LNELEIILTEINPVDFFGYHNVNLDTIKSFYPKLKIIARDNKIKAYGEIDMLNDFDKKIKFISKNLINKNFLNSDDIERFLMSDSYIESNKMTDKKTFILHGVKGKVIKTKTPNQLKLLNSINKNDVIFAIGPAGTGKTYTSIAMAVNALKEKKVNKIILTRPAVEAGENLGFLPGDLKEKLDPYMQPLYDALKDMIPSEKLKKFIEKEIIQIAPLAFMRGRTLDNAFVILDEAQNTSHSQMKMFLTRMGANTKFIITGDPGQIDLPKKIVSGLKEALIILDSTNGIDIIHFDEKDVLRNKIVKKIINAYKSIENQN
tara:strand:+ start:8079 stop:9032 length:954 start_codon:yes stop_codon:yes gene_type:complete